ncbi:MAG: DNA methyltransferase [Rhodocyclaceae bacterium]
MQEGIFLGDARELERFADPASIALSVWSPPYHVGKSYERDQSFAEWKALLRRTLQSHARIIKPGGFVAINIADILCFPDPAMPRLMAENVSRRKRGDITREAVLQAMARHPGKNRREIAAILGCSEQTVDRRLKGNNIRGGKYQTQTRVFLVGGLLEQLAMEAGFYLYDRRVWVKDAAWENSRWHTMSYRAVDEFEYIYVFWRPGPMVVDRGRLSRDEWIEWGSRAVWRIPSVRANDDHEAKFPLELPRRLIQLLSSPDDWVMDPFVGSGTSAVAAVMEGRRFIGIDKEIKYVEMARAAYRNACAQPGLFDGHTQTAMAPEQSRPVRSAAS